MTCACGATIRRFSKRGKPYKYCSPECDKAAMSERMSGRRRKSQLAVDYTAVLADLQLKRDTLQEVIDSLRILEAKMKQL